MNENFLDFISGFGNKQIAEIGLMPLAGLLVVSLISSFVVSYLYVHFFKQRATGSQIHRSFPLLGVSITAIFICIQFSLPLSLGLLGALSIVRFRTPVKEPEEIGFLMLLIATSISCATFNLAFLAVILLVATLGLLVAKSGGVIMDNYLSSGMIHCTIPAIEDGGKTVESILGLIGDSIKGSRVDSINENDTYSVVCANFQKLSAEDLVIFRQQVAQVDDKIKIDVFYNNRVV